MVISSNALFHFTRSMEDIGGILEKGFTARFCLENYSNLFDDSDNGFTMAFPMVCFCDLPISQLRSHMDFYGSYGLGMKKDWGIKNGINPVMYMHPGSDTAGYIGRLLRYPGNRAGEDEAEEKEKEEAIVFRKCLRSVIRQIKLYEGYVEKDGKQVLKRFYDEREWRWVPYVTEDDDSDLLSLTSDTYNDLRAGRQVFGATSKAAYEATPETSSNAACLSFKPDDIDYIIVAKESEIVKVIEAVEKFGRRYDQKTIKILTTRIISSERIRSDF